MVGAQSKKILYVGNDKNYWDSIKARFQRVYDKLNFEFLTIADEEQVNYQLIYANLLNSLPQIIYIDFSSNMEQQLKLTQFLTRDNTLREIPIIGLLDEKSKSMRCWAAGVQCMHIKCGEQHDVVYDPFLMAFPKEVVKPTFAKGKTKEEIEIIGDFRVGYITPESLHAEGNIPLNIGDEVSIKTHIPSDVISSQKYIVKDVKDYDLYYDFNYSYCLDFVYVDPPDLASVDEEIDAASETDEHKKKKLQQKADLAKRHKKAEHEEELRRAKKRLKDWVLENSKNSLPKKTKVYVIDEKMYFLRDTKTKLLKEYPYTIRCQTILSDEMNEIYSLRPNIIAFQFLDDVILETVQKPAKIEKVGQEKPEEIEEKTMTDEERAEREKLKEELVKRGQIQIQKIIAKVKSIEGYNPIIVVFNCDRFSSKSFQDTYNYPLIIAHKEYLNIDTVLNMAEMYELRQDVKLETKIEAKINALRKENPQKYRNITKKDFEEPRFYISKSNVLSYASYKYSSILESISESEITFLTEFELAIGRSFRLEKPFPMSIVLLPDGDKGVNVVDGKNQYFSIIHTINEDDKKLLRKYINQTFFSELNEKRAKEKEEFEQKKAQAIKDKKEQVSGEKEREQPLEEGQPSPESLEKESEKPQVNSTEASHNKKEDS